MVEFAMLQFVREGVIVEDFAGRVLFINESACEILGIHSSDSAEMIALKFPKVLKQDRTDLDMRRLPPVVARETRKRVDQTIGMQQKDQDVKWIEVSSVPVFETDQQGISRIVTTFRDVSAEMTANQNFLLSQKHLADAENFFSSTLDRLPCLVTYVNPEMKNLYVNATYQRWHGDSPKSVIGRTILEASGPEVFAAVEPRMRRALKGEVVRFETHIPDHPFGIYHSQIHYYPDFNENGLVQGVYCVVEDITQIKAAEKALRESEQLANMLDNIPGSISIWGLDFRNVHATQDYAKLWGKTVGELRGMKLNELIGDSIFTEDADHIQNVLNGHHVTFERTLPSHQGGFIDFLVSLFPQFKDGKVVGFYIMANDISLLKATEAEKREMESKLVAASKMSSLGEMAGGVAHEINNPLAIISGRASVIQNILTDDAPNLNRAMKELDRINVTVERIAKIIRGLRAFARNADSDSPSVCSLATILHDTIELCHERMKNLGIEFKIEMSEDIKVSCRPAQISQIVMNLIGNAIDAIETLPTKWIHLKVESASSRVRISVVDSGSGIPASVVDKMMNPFFTTKEIGKGTGLGLSISRGLAEKNNAELKYVDSENTMFVLEMELSQKVDEGRAA